MPTAEAPDYPQGSSYEDYLHDLQSNYEEEIHDDLLGRRFKCLDRDTPQDRPGRWSPDDPLHDTANLFPRILDVKDNIITETFPNDAVHAAARYRRDFSLSRERLWTEFEAAINTPPPKDVRTRIIWVRYAAAYRAPALWLQALRYDKSKFLRKPNEYPYSKRMSTSQLRATYKARSRLAVLLGGRYRLDPMFFLANFNQQSDRTDLDLLSRDQRDIHWPRQPLPSMQQKMVHIVTADHILSAAFIPPQDTELDAPTTVIVLCQCTSSSCFEYSDPLTDSDSNDYGHSLELSRTRYNLRIFTLNNRLLPNPKVSWSLDPYYHPRSIKNKDNACALYIDALSIMSPEELKSANRDPVEFIYPYFRTVAHQYNIYAERCLDKIEAGLEGDMLRKYGLDAEYAVEAEARKQGARENKYEGALFRLRQTWHAISAIERQVCTIYSGLSVWIPEDESMSRPRGGEVIKRDYAALIERLKRARRDLQERMSMEVGVASWEESRTAVLESRRNIVLADSVKRLTLVAVIFAPLSLASSVYGMNFFELGSGELRIWIFIVTVLAFVLVTGLVVAMCMYSREQRSAALDRTGNSMRRALGWITGDFWEEYMPSQLADFVEYLVFMQWRLKGRTYADWRAFRKQMRASNELKGAYTLDVLGKRRPIKTDALYRIQLWEEQFPEINPEKYYSHNWRLTPMSTKAMSGILARIWSAPVSKGFTTLVRHEVEFSKGQINTGLGVSRSCMLPEVDEEAQMHAMNSGGSGMEPGLHGR